MAFTSKITKKYIIETLADIKNFDMEMALYQEAGSFSAALSLFFERLLSRVKAVNHFYSTLSIITADVVSLRSKGEIKTQIIKYLKKTYDDTILLSIKQYVDIAKLYQKPRTEIKTSTLLKDIKSYLKKLDAEFLIINKKAMYFLVLAKKYNLDKQSTFSKNIKKLEFLTEVNTTSFIAFLKEGNIDLLL